MKLEGPGTLLRIHIGESDRWNQHPLYEAIQAFPPALDEMVAEGLITLEKVQIVRYRSRET